MDNENHARVANLSQRDSYWNIGTKTKTGMLSVFFARRMGTNGTVRACPFSSSFSLLTVSLCISFGARAFVCQQLELCCSSIRCELGLHDNSCDRLRRQVTAHDRKRTNLLHAACEMGHADLASALIDDYSMAVEEQDRKGLTPLARAAQRNQVRNLRQGHVWPSGNIGLKQTGVSGRCNSIDGKA